MQNTKIRILQTYVLWFIDTVCIILSLNLSFMIRFGRFLGRRHNYGAEQLVLASLLFVVAYNFFLDWNHDFFIRGYLKEFISVLKFNTALIVVDLMYIFFARRAAMMSRLVIARFFLINLVLSYLLHILFKKILRKQMRQEMNVRKLFVVAERELMEQTLSRIRNTMGNIQTAGILMRG